MTVANRQSDVLEFCMANWATPLLSWALVATREGEGEGWKMEEIVQHGGGKMSMVSAAARWGPRTVLGGP